MGTVGEKPRRQLLGNQKLPIAVYREVVGHLRQVDGVDADMIGQKSREFDYSKSQVGGLSIQYAADAEEKCYTGVEKILAIYSDRYGAWEVLESE